MQVQLDGISLLTVFRLLHSFLVGCAVRESLTLTFSETAMGRQNH